MYRWTRPLLVTAAVLTLGLGGVAVASGASQGSPEQVSQVKPVSPAAPAIQPLTNAPDVTALSQYVPISPCRIVDTRATGARIPAGATREFHVTGKAGFSPQGGHSLGCGIPHGASAIAVNLTATSASTPGIVRTWPADQAPPNATTLTYDRGLSTGTGATLPIQVTSASSNDPELDVRVSSAAHIIIDVFGYYREPIAAAVSSSGVLGAHSNQVLSATRNSGNPTGVYQVNLDQSVAGCIVSATPATTGYVLVTAITNDKTVLLVTRAPNTGTLVDAPVHLTVTC